MRPSQTQDKFIVRLPDGMREQISEAAAANNRSMTAEIVARLAWSFEQAHPAVGHGPSINAQSDIETLRDQIRVEAMERKLLQERLARLENAGAPDLYHIEMRLHALESKC